MCVKPARMDRKLTYLTALLGFTGVAFGAFGAHGLKKFVAELPDAADRLAWWETGARYHLIHALAVGLVAVLAAHVAGRFPAWAAWSFAVGIILFSGSLYTMALTGLRPLGAGTPLGGVAFLLGWLAIGLAARKLGVEGPRPGEP